MLLIKIPSSLGSLGKNTGCEKAPDKIIETLKEFYSNEDGKEVSYNIIEVEVHNNNIEKTNEDIYEKTKNLENGIILGGDHSITYSCFKAFSRRYKNPGIVIFDAHPDLEVNTESITHEDYLKALIKEGYLKRENLIIVGLRNNSENENHYLKENKIKFYDMKKIFNNIENTCDAIMESSRNFDGLYLSIDIDCVDPSFAPGTYYKEPGGLTSREILYFIQRLKLLKSLKFVDIVEVNPKLDLNNITVKLAAKIVNEIL